MSIALAYVVGTLLSAGCLWAVTRWAGAAVPIVDLVIIAGLCSGLAMLPYAGWALATLIMSLLVMRLIDVDLRPDTVLMVVGCSVVWLVARATFLG